MTTGFGFLELLSGANIACYLGFLLLVIVFTVSSPGNQIAKRSILLGCFLLITTYLLQLALNWTLPRYFTASDIYLAFTITSLVTTFLHSAAIAFFVHAALGKHRLQPLNPIDSKWSDRNSPSLETPSNVNNPYQR